MKFFPMHFSFVLLIMFFLAMVADVYGCSNVIHCNHYEDALMKTKNRKVNFGTWKTGNNNGRKLVRVPSGPDPLHHNGIVPKKPGNL